METMLFPPSLLRAAHLSVHEEERGEGRAGGVGGKAAPSSPGRAGPAWDPPCPLRALPSIHAELLWLPRGEPCVMGTILTLLKKKKKKMEKTKKRKEKKKRGAWGKKIGTYIVESRRQ